MYNVENINETNVFVVKKDNAVKRITHRKNAEDATYYVPKGTLVHIGCSALDITDSMLKSAKEKGSRMRFNMYIFPSIGPYIDTAEVMPCQLRRATKEEVAQCIKYAEEFNNALEEHLRKQDEENERKRAERKAVQERKACELDEFRGSLKGKWTKFVAKVMRKLAVELLFLAGKCNKKQMANNERLGCCHYDRIGYLSDDSFKKLYGLTIDEFVEKRREFINSGHSGREWDEKFSSRRGYNVELDRMGTLLTVLGYIKK